MIYAVIYRFCSNEWKLKNVRNFYVNCMIRNIKQALEHGLKLKKVCKAIAFVKKDGLNHIVI